MLDSRCYRAAAARDPFRRQLVFDQPALAVTLALEAVLVLAVAALALEAYLPPGVVGFLAIGAGIGVATCIPIGIANVIVIDAAYRYGARRAIGASIGGALADGVYASLGIFGIGPLIDRYPAVPFVLHSISGAVLLVYGLVLLRARTVMPEGAEPRSQRPADGQLWGGFVVGLLATLLNPSAVVTWIVIVGGHATGVTRLEAGAWVTGIVVGTFAWFLVVAFLALRGRRVLQRKAVWMTRVVGLVVIGSGLFSLSRVIGYVVHG